MSKAAWRDRLPIGIALGASICAIAASIVLAFSYENLRRQLAGISSELARLPTPAISREHVDARTFILRSKLSRATEPVVVFGDSIVEAADLPASICGHAVVNAGIGGATIGYFVRNAALLLREVKPSLIVLAVGINDASRGGQADRIEPFREAYRAALQSLPDVPHRDSYDYTDRLWSCLGLVRCGPWLINSMLLFGNLRRTTVRWLI